MDLGLPNGYPEPTCQTNQDISLLKAMVGVRGQAGTEDIRSGTTSMAGRGYRG